MPSGHVLNMCMLSCIINDEHIFLSFGKDLHGQSPCRLYMAFQLLQNMASGHVKVKKGTGHIFYMITPSHANESEPLHWSGNSKQLSGGGMEKFTDPMRSPIYFLHVFHFSFSRTTTYIYTNHFKVDAQACSIHDEAQTSTCFVDSLHIFLPHSSLSISNGIALKNVCIHEKALN